MAIGTIQVGVVFGHSTVSMLSYPACSEWDHILLVGATTMIGIETIEEVAEGITVPVPLQEVDITGRVVLIPDQAIPIVAGAKTDRRLSRESLEERQGLAPHTAIAEHQEAMEVRGQEVVDLVNSSLCTNLEKYDLT